MSTTSVIKMNLPKRLIEVDLPIKRISAHARREKSIRHGHISTLHIWWARRPLAACRAVICAALWFDPADENCPPQFRETVQLEMIRWARDSRGLMSPESYDHFDAVQKKPALLDDDEMLQTLLLDFIADFANWDNSTRREYLETSRALTAAAHLAAGGEPGTRPLIVDPFAGGGAIPLEALRIGADTFASDLNPVAVLLNKVVLEYVPRYGERLAEEVRKWGSWVQERAKKELAEFYPNDADGATPIAYLWARTIICEGPACGAKVPLVRSLWLAKKPNRSIALRLVSRKEEKRVAVEIITKAKARDVGEGTVRRGSAICPICGFTTPVTSVRKQLRQHHGGVYDAQLMCVVTTNLLGQGRSYRLPTKGDFIAVHRASEELVRKKKEHQGKLSLAPNESTTHYETFVNRGPIYGMTTWEDYYTPRQILALTTIVSLIQSIGENASDDTDAGLSMATQTCLALILDKSAQYNSSLCRWKATGENLVDTFGRQALPMVWDFAEAAPYGGASGDLTSQIDWHTSALSATSKIMQEYAGQVESASATMHPLLSDSADAFVTDPPYYYSIQYADLSDFFYVWLKRTLAMKYPDLLGSDLTPKEDEIIVQSPGHQYAPDGKNKAFYESKMKDAMGEGRRILSPSGIGIVVFAHTSTAGWESQLQAMIDAGWTVTGSWPIDTEMATRVIAQGRSVLASSIHLVCRPRENADGSLRMDDIGDWRDVLRDLPIRIHQWMPRLAAEGVVGADAIFACLGPALEIFSRYTRVEKASGEQVTLREYLEYVWAAVAKEALNMIFRGADASGFEEDARLTAMWLWTLSPGPQSVNGSGENEEDSEVEVTDEANERSGKSATTTGFILEYDAVRKIAQGLGAHLEELSSLVEIKGDQARLLPVAERTNYLFNIGETEPSARSSKKKAQPKLFQELEESANDNRSWGAHGSPPLGNTALDRIHQGMILFAAGRTEALRRFLVDDGAGSDERFWRLANALSALYPANGDEKRWVDGVLARKKGLGF